MAVTLNGANYANAEEFNPSIENILARGLWNANVKCQVNKHTLDSGATADGGAFATGSTLTVGRIPVDSTLLAVVVYTDGLGSATLDLGDGTTADKWGTFNTTAAGTIIMAPIETVDEATDIVLTGADATATNGKVINTVVVYSVE